MILSYQEDTAGKSKQSNRARAKMMYGLSGKKNGAKVQSGTSIIRMKGGMSLYWRKLLLIRANTGTR